MGIRERILEIIEEKGLSKRKFYNSIGVSSGFLNKSKNIGSDKVTRILENYPDISVEWLLFGRGEMHRKIEDKVSFIGKIPVTNIHNIVQEPPRAYGGQIKSSSKFQVLDILSLGKNFEDCSNAVQIWGDSLAPMFYSGDIVILRYVRNIAYLQWGYAHLIVTKDQNFFKIIQHHPTNDDAIMLGTGDTQHAAFEIPKKDILHVFEARGLVRKLIL